MIIANTLVQTLMTLALVLLATGPGQGVPVARAQSQGHDAHAHASPHGGQVVSSGPYHVELVVTEQRTVQVYLFDNAMQPLAAPAQEATLYLRLPGNVRQTVTLKATGSGPASYLTGSANLDGVQTFEAALRLALDGEARNLRFTYDTAHAEPPARPGSKR